MSAIMGNTLQQDPIHERAASSMSGQKPTTQSEPFGQSSRVSSPFPTRQLSDVPSHPSGPRLHCKSTISSVPSVPTQPARFEVNKPNEYACPSVVSAAADGSGHMVEKLLTSGANIEALHTTTKKNALITAAEHGHVEIVEFLLDHKCSTQHLDSVNMSALHYAAQKGYLPVAKALLDRVATIDIQGSNGLTPLYLASRAPHANMVMLLLQRGADVNGRDSYQRTALHVAASRGFSNICITLLDNGAQIEARNGNSKTPLQLPVTMEQIEVAEVLFSRSNLQPTDVNFNSAFSNATEVGNVRLVEAFVDRGATLKGLKGDLYKPMILASKNGNVGMVEFIIRLNGKTNEKDDNVWTALHHAAYLGHTPIVDRLVDKEISSSKTTNKKETPLLLAVKTQQLGATELLLRSKAAATINQKDFNAQEAFHHAVRSGDLNLVNLLFSHKANLHSENGFGWKPIHIAVAYGHLPVIKHLLGLGANIEDRLGKTDVKQSQTHAFVESGY